MAQISLDQSAAVKCPVHGKIANGLFIRPDAGEYFPAFYACPFCNQSRGTVTRETAVNMQRLK